MKCKVEGSKMIYGEREHRRELSFPVKSPHFTWVASFTTISPKGGYGGKVREGLLNYAKPPGAVAPGGFA